VVVRADKLLDVRTSKTLTNQAIVIEDGKILSGGPDTGSPPDARVIDLSSKTVLPGPIDAHTPITFDPRFVYDRLAISVPRARRSSARKMHVSLCWPALRPFATWGRPNLPTSRCATLAIQAATMNDADLLGWSDKVGVIEPNHYADIIAVDGDRKSVV